MYYIKMAEFTPPPIFTATPRDSKKKKKKSLRLLNTHDNKKVGRNIDNPADIILSPTDTHLHRPLSTNTRLPM